MPELNQLETEELFCPGDLEIEVNNGGGKWKASFPNERISQTPVMNLVYVGKYLLEITFNIYFLKFPTLFHANFRSINIKSF